MPCADAEYKGQRVNLIKEEIISMNLFRLVIVPIKTILLPESSCLSLACNIVINERLAWKKKKPARETSRT